MLIRQTLRMFALALGLLAVVLSGDAALAACSCNPPADKICPGGCLSCQLQQVYCTCSTACTFACGESCGAGYEDLGCSASGCFPGWLSRSCRRSRYQLTDRCQQCRPARWGPECQFVCPGGVDTPCSGHGTCSEGLSGNGTCACQPGFGGTACERCADGYYNYPECSRCDRVAKCNDRGTCAADGSCVCDPGYYGVHCQSTEPLTEAVCADALDNDGDGAADCADPDCCDDADHCGGPDLDGDGYRACDCNDADPALWTTPSEVGDLVLLADGRTLAWSPPARPGAATLAYDTLRTDRPWDFVTLTTCVETGDGADTQADDVARPVPGSAFFYVVRATTGCGPGPAGRDTSGGMRRARSCP